MWPFIFQELSKNLQTTTHDLESFKLVLQTITDVVKTNVSAELMYLEVAQRFKTMRLHDIEVSRTMSRIFLTH